jgi:ferredoxin, 2Fe-2S
MTTETSRMPQVTYIEHDGTTHTVPVEAGKTLMEGAVQHGVEGIVAECGGACACATCHCYIDDAWIEKVDQMDAMEEAMLDAVLEPKPSSRLACQVQISSDLDGLLVRLPESQI